MQVSYLEIIFEQLKSIKYIHNIELKWKKENESRNIA